MRKLFALILLLMIIALILPQAGRAQEEIQLDKLIVNLWPEYDRAEMLVILMISLQPEAVPADLTFRIPKVAGKPYKVASWADDDNLYETEYTYQSGSEWGEVSFRANSAKFQLEYYDPRLVRQGPSRKYDYTWPGDYAVTSATIDVQQPVDASQMQFTPEGVTSFTGGDDLLHYTLDIGTLRKDQTYDFSLNYQKSTNVLTYEKQQVRPAGTLPQSMWMRGLPWALGVLALVLIAGGVFVYWRSGLPQAGKKKRQRRKAVTQASDEVAAEDSGVYCHSCGRRASLSDVFCRSCGTKLRI